MPNMNQQISDDQIINCIRDIKKLERQLFSRQRLNIFEAIGFERQEIKHSKLLTYLLNPNNPHLLGDEFFKELLLSAAQESSHHKKYALKFITQNFDDLQVRAEWRSIDIYAYSRRNRLVIAIENKIDATEHGNQLERYEKKLEEKHPGDTIIRLYLTPFRSESTRRDQWIAIDYSQVLRSLKAACETKSIPKNSDSNRLIDEYINLIERSILMDNPEQKEAFDEIYAKHQVFFDAIIKHIELKEKESSLGNEIITELQKLLQKSDIQIDLQGRYSKNNGDIQLQGFTIKDWRIAEITNGQWFGKKQQSPLMWVLESNAKDGQIFELTIFLEIDKNWLKAKIGAGEVSAERFSELRNDFVGRYEFQGKANVDYNSARLIQREIDIPNKGDREDSELIAQCILDQMKGILTSTDLPAIFEELKEKLALKTQ